MSGNPYVIVTDLVPSSNCTESNIQLERRITCPFSVRNVSGKGFAFLCLSLFWQKFVFTQILKTTTKPHICVCYTFYMTWGKDGTFGNARVALWSNVENMWEPLKPLLSVLINPLTTHTTMIWYCRKTTLTEVLSLFETFINTWQQCMTVQNVFGVVNIIIIIIIMTTIINLIFVNIRKCPIRVVVCPLSPIGRLDRQPLAQV